MTPLQEALNGLDDDWETNIPIAGFDLKGRAARYFEQDPQVEKLVLALSDHPDPHPIVQRYLGTLAKDIKAGELYRHEHQVMAVMYALKKANWVLEWMDLAEVFAVSNVAEIVHVSRFARELLTSNS